MCGKDVHLPHSDLRVKAIKLKDSSFLALLYTKRLFGLHIIFQMVGQCFQSFFCSSSHSLTLKMHLAVCQSAQQSLPALTWPHGKALVAALGAAVGVPQPGGSPWAGGVLAVPHSRYSAERQGGICSSKLWVIWFPFLPPKVLRAVHFSKVMKWQWQTKDVGNREIHMRKSTEFIEKVTNFSCLMMFSW